MNIEYLPDDKEYLATIQFGKSTNTYDIEGETTFESDKRVCEQEIIEKLKDFQGEIEQLPPIFSAIKVKGKKLYEYARKGEDVEIQPRKVTIYNIELKSFDFDLQQAQILVKCSKGTYIRSIANDLGEILGCGGHLIRLVRTQAGKFRIEAAKQLGSYAAKSEDSETLQAQQNDNYPSPQPFSTTRTEFSLRKASHKTILNRFVRQSPSRGEGACHDCLATIYFPLSTFNLFHRIRFAYRIDCFDLDIGYQFRI